ncbi:MAG: hypothetical protein BWX85_00878 [Chloroflexi bacterium ADurb.Bin120]|jgi:cytochrome c biogenesis protein CcdA/glutaredoxin|uniref:Uncharacterized protein n=1 Tax=Candidatus Brevifilum fermentans TaxID=1986204 RepID=A0A1Y6K270_9CHLR|nr:hypothetical protein [Brevefilum fermentans]MDI9565426.1 hypothetical protein [Chloroflexota bacterium]OQB84841.1 MAG: hypothetical protein BWX85_00878 [Chloroflexi bacterium ADurb.Bin120]SMX53763.1 conserved membrane protein of unknown function [Brevefilum fermentans]HOM67855.1 hypothetical protein [Brevefilum fermentans]
MFKNIKNVLVKFFVAILIISAPIMALSIPPVSAVGNTVNVYFFEGEGCPYCARTREFLLSLSEQDERIVIHEFEVYFNLEDREFFVEFAAVHGFEPAYVPTTFIGDQYWVGFNEAIQGEITQKIQYCLVNDCVDYGVNILPPDTFPEQPQPEPPPILEEPEIQEPEIQAPEIQAPEIQEPETQEPEQEELMINLPFIGKVNLADKSLLLSTLLIALVDGFNPCSIWVLSLLLAITLNSRSRKKVLIIGLVFIFVTGFVYALFISGLFTVFTFVGYTGWIQFIVAVFALFFAVVNIKDYFWYKEGFSFTISDEKKPGIYKGIRKVMRAEGNIWALIGATVVLSAGVSIVEFSCTAGFPVIWTNLLVVHEATGLAFLGFLLVYMLVYQMDELAIFLTAVFTLRKSKMEEKYGRILKLLGGILMLALAIVMLIDPALMNNIGSSLLVFGVAFGVTGLILLIHQVLLPKIKQRTLQSGK